ncbi:tRNA 2'-phosphotransferase 1 [Pseudocercospora fuligena]|uniref:2'-phosphotransferase n=1 Tax=Pseudocercospora fuligena TaxID=685502 RepID=A0A8H6RJJ6_9PEZI|nr:tRNA 2'-phosphotransferase 1 [Pseudocercospora fuligena]
MSSRGGGKRGRGGPLPRDVQVSKKLSSVLRHNAEKEGLKLDSSGYVNLSDLLQNRNFKSMKVTFEEVQEIVKDNDKQRFTMIPASGENPEEINGQPSIPSTDPKDWLIRANQGHSLKIESEGLLKQISAAEGNVPETAVHGTTHSAWMLIVSSGGLKPMGRNHVHFASGLPAGFKSVVEQDDQEAQAQAPVISGMRNSSTVLMFLDVKKAMEAGVKLWLSDNGVILSEGNEDGVIPLELFKRVEDRTGEGVLLEDGKVVKEAPQKWAGKGARS